MHGQTPKVTHTPPKGQLFPIAPIMASRTPSDTPLGPLNLNTPWEPELSQVWILTGGPRLSRTIPPSPNRPDPAH